MHPRKQEWAGIGRRIYERMGALSVWPQLSATAQLSGYHSQRGLTHRVMVHWEVKDKGRQFILKLWSPVGQSFLCGILIPLYLQVMPSWALSRVCVLVSQGSLLRWKVCWALGGEGMPWSPCRIAAKPGWVNLESGGEWELAWPLGCWEASWGQCGKAERHGWVRAIVVRCSWSPAHLARAAGKWD